MKLGFVTAILPELTLEEVLKVAADIGYDCVEVMCWPQGKAERRYAGVTHIDVASLDIGGVKRIHDQCHQYGVEISALGYYPNPLSPNRLEATNAISHIRKVIDASKLLGLSGMNTFIGRDWSKSVESNWPEFLRVWKPLIKYAETQNVRIGIENCPMSFTSDEWPGGKNLKTTPSIFRRMYQDIPSEYFGLNFDPSHFIWLQMNYVKTILEFGQKLFHMHAKDVRLDTDRLDEVGILAHPNEYHTPKLPGMGDVNWADFFNALTTAGYNGPVCVEVEDRDYEGSLERRIEALKVSHDYLRQYIPTVR